MRIHHWSVVAFGFYIWKCFWFKILNVCDLIFHGLVSEHGNKRFINFYLVTFVTFAVPNVNKMIILGVSTHKMSMENNLVLTWHILTGRVVFSSFSSVAPHTYMLSWAPNSCCRHSLVLSATCWQSRRKLALQFSLCTSSHSQSGYSLPSLAHPFPSLSRRNGNTHLSCLTCHLFLVLWFGHSLSLFWVPFLSQCHRGVAAAHWEIGNAAPCRVFGW